MKEKTSIHAFFTLLALLLASVLILPPVIADEQAGSGFDLDNHVIPELKFNESMEMIAISGELSPQKESGNTAKGTYGIPYGSIVVHSADRITRVFDRDGNQILSISDEQSEKIPTPAGVEKPCTKVFQLPSGSRAYYRGENEVFVLSPEGELILIVIDESGSEMGECSICSGKKIDDTTHVSVSADGSLIAAGSPSSGIICLLGRDGNALWSYGTGDSITGTAISDDGNYIAATTFCGDLYYFTEKGDLLWQKVIVGCNNRVELSGDGQTGYVFADSTVNGMLNGEYYERRPQNVCHFDRNGTIYWHENIPGFEFSISSDGKYFVSNSHEKSQGIVSLYSDEGTRLWEYRGYMYLLGSSISDDGDTIAANIWRNLLVVMDINGDILWQVKPKYMMESVAVSPDGNFIAAGTQYKLLCYNRAGDLLWEFDSDDYIRDIAISKDSRYLAGKCEDDVFLFDGSGELLWKRHVEDGIGSLAISENGMTVAAGTYNNSVCLFDNASNAKVIYLDDLQANPLPVPVSEKDPVSPSSTESAPLSLVPVFAALFILGFLWRR